MKECPRCGSSLSEYGLGDVEAYGCDSCGWVGVPVDHQSEPEQLESWQDAISRFEEKFSRDELDEHAAQLATALDGTDADPGDADVAGTDEDVESDAETGDEDPSTEVAEDTTPDADGEDGAVDADADSDETDTDGSDTEDASEDVDATEVEDADEPGVEDADASDVTDRDGDDADHDEVEVATRGTDG